VFRIIGQYDISRDGDIIRVWSSPESWLEGELGRAGPILGACHQGKSQ
jgi:hypothetical protein